MRREAIIIFVIWMVAAAGCVQEPLVSPKVHINRTSVASLIPDSLPAIGVTLVRPYSTSSRVRGSSLIQFNSVSMSSSYIGDTQYMTTIAVKKYSEIEWSDRLKFGSVLTSRITDSDWLEFKKWSYSEPQMITMRERDGFRYYLRVIKHPRVGIIEIWAEHNCFQREFIEEDDGIIRKIMDSVAIDPEMIKTTEPVSAGDVLKAAPEK